VAADPAAALLTHAADLERRDAAIARELDTVRGLAERAGQVRARAGEARAALERIPVELEELGARRAVAGAEAARAGEELERAESRLAALESSRRRREDELDRARKELATARDALADARTQVERIDERAALVRDEQRSLAVEADALGAAAAQVASAMQDLARLGEAAAREPGTTLDDVEEWGGHARSALFVARGTLESERERIVLEANELGSSVLGEPLGASSVALVRRRLAAHLG
jgi:chromosome segregation ATPase